MGMIGEGRREVTPHQRSGAGTPAHGRADSRGRWAHPPAWRRGLDHQATHMKHAPLLGDTGVWVSSLRAQVPSPHMHTKGTSPKAP